MSDDEKNAGEGGTATAAASVPSEQPYLDEHTTEPNAPAAPAPRQAAPGKWQMPKPKFQQSSGYLPQGYVKQAEAAASGPAPASEPDPTPAVSASSDGAAVPLVEPQPDLTQLIVDDPAPETTAAPAQQKGSSAFPFVILILLAAIVLLVVLLAVVYFVFLANPTSGNNF
jgi:hypothetical protein